jgi:hypothetical protein
MTTGWKYNKAEQCKSNAMTIIVASVRPFLDDYWEGGSDSE